MWPTVMGRAENMTWEREGEGGRGGKRKDKEEGRTLGRLLTVFGYSETLDSIDREKSR